MAQARYANASFWDVITVTPRLYEVISTVSFFFLF